ncbi:MAG TPA: SDR family oxidoreductase [Streptosporangiaceae bacterium]|jgi:NAD(P)-dependent dehydrogenase (short-subunit alcohol dehydrogenase family)
MLLADKHAIIYGAGGAVGGAVARAFARDGASVFLAGRTLAPVQAVAGEILAEGGTAAAAQADALDEQSVEQHVAGVAAAAGRIDILFNAIGMEDIQGTPLLDIPAADFMHPVVTAARTQFLTARAVARHMIGQRAGVIMSVTAEPTPAANLGGYMPACAAVEGLWRSLACELGPHGVRLVILRSAGSPDSPGVREVIRLHAEAAGSSLAEFETEAASGAMLRRLPLLAEVAAAATLYASDRASAITAALANVTCGAFTDL